MNLQMFDRVFLVLFARSRRKMDDSRLEAAWVLAADSVSSALILPFSGVTVLVIATINAITPVGTASQYRWWGLVLGFPIWWLSSLYLDRRFKKYLLTPPPVPTQESPAEKYLVVKFRALMMGVFVLTGLLLLGMFYAGHGLT